MSKNKKARVQQSAKSESLQEFLRNAVEDHLSKFSVVLSKALEVKEQRLQVNEADREKLEGKVQSLENQTKNQKNQIKKLEKKIGHIYKLLLLERNKVKRLEEEISILKLDSVLTDIDKEIESLTKDDDTEEPNRDNPDVTSNEQAKDVDSDDVEESEDESDHEESTEDNERVIVKKEMTSDNEDEAAEPSDANIRDSTPTKRTSNEKLLTEAESEEDDDDVGNVDRNGDREEEGDGELEELLRTTLYPFL